MMQAPCGARLRAWSLASDTDLDAPHRTGRAYRFSPMRSAQRVLLATGERLGFRPTARSCGCCCATLRTRTAISNCARGPRWVASAGLGARFVSRGFGAGHAERHCGVAGAAGGGSTERGRVTKDLRVQARGASKASCKRYSTIPPTLATRLAPVRRYADGKKD